MTVMIILTLIVISIRSGVVVYPLINALIRLLSTFERSVRLGAKETR
jgi:hypothetical protein